MTYDTRLTPARPDLAAEHLREIIQADAYAPGRRMQVVRSFVDVKRAPADNAPTDTQALFGETLIVYEQKNGYCWAQLDRDRYVGYIDETALAEKSFKPNHRVRTRHTMVYSRARHQIAARRRAAVRRGSQCGLGEQGFFANSGRRPHLQPAPRADHAAR